MGDRPSSRLVWLGFFGVILVLALLAGFAFLRGGRQLAELQVQQQAEPVQQLLYVILNGEQRVVPEAKRLQLSLDIQSAVDEEQGKLLERMRQQIDAAVDTAFAPVHDHVGDFADWYYSLTGEYMRYAHAVGGDMGEYMQQQLKETVFLPAALEANLDNMLADINARLSRDIRQSGDRFSSRLQLVIAAGSWPVGSGEPVFGGSLNLDEMFASGVQLSSRDLNRQVVAALAATGTGVVLAKGVGAVVVKKTLAKVAGTKSFHVASALLAKLVAKSAVKGGGMLAGAGAGTAICSPAGPGALVCGAIGGLIAWLAVDKAVIELDEALNRDVFEDDMHAAITAQQQQLKAALQQAYARVLNAGFAPVKQGARTLAVPVGKFTPADSVFRDY
ncbi:hypothetical protein [Thiolapillus sp.]|uniref:hypothetical protein n=3 Tax=Thiolapillus sp. TaxID=2017437 RepID=UPI003AF832B4